LEGGLRIAVALSPSSRFGIREQLRRVEKERKVDNAKLGDLVRPSAIAEIVYELKPNLSGTFLGKDISFNSQSMRNREVSEEKPSGTVRLAGVGDSIMFGWGVGQEEMYLRIVERELNERYPQKQWEVLNFAVPGYNTVIEAAVVEHKVLRYRPDALIIHFVKNDDGVPAFLLEPDNPFTLQKSFVVELVRQRLYPESLEDVDDLFGVSEQSVKRERGKRVLSEYQHLLGWQAFERAMERIARLAERQNIPVIVIYGSARRDQRRTLRGFSERHGFVIARLRPHLRAYVAEKGLEKALAENPTLFVLSRQDHHPNAQGHRIYARALMSALEESGFVARAAGD
jgi:hypothetical protein